MIYGYVRESLPSEGNRDTVAYQSFRLEESGCDEIVCESEPNGTDTFVSLAKDLKKGDALRVCSVDRVRLPWSEFATFVREAKERGVAVQTLEQGLTDFTSEATFVLQTIYAVAEYERELRAKARFIGKLSIEEVKDLLTKMVDMGIGTSLSVSVAEDGRGFQCEVLEV